ncbi:MAG: EamA family transporter, partial [Planctomycetota bacterium]
VQFAFANIGLSLTVPILLGTLIVGSGIFGWLILGEGIRRRMIYSMVVLMVAMVVLSIGERPPNITPMSILGLPPEVSGVLAALLAGAAYAFFGASLKRTFRDGMSVPATMFCSGSIGFVMMVAAMAAGQAWAGGESVGMLANATDADATITLNFQSPDPRLGVSQWASMILAGIFNFVAFCLLSICVKSVSVMTVNLINASQAALAAVAGVMIYAEPVTAHVIIGIGLTFVGLAILGERKEKATISESGTIADNT